MVFVFRQKQLEFFYKVSRIFLCTTVVDQIETKGNNYSFFLSVSDVCFRVVDRDNPFSGYLLS